MNTNITKLSFGIAVVAALCVVGSAVAAVEVKLHDHVMPKASIVRLGDIADVVGKDHQAVKKLSTVPLMPAPAPDTERFLRKREIADMLAANGVEIGEIHFSGAEQVAISAVSNVQTVAYQEPANATNANADTLASGHTVTPASAKVSSTPAKLDDAQAEDVKNQLCGLLSDYLKQKSGKPAIGKIDCDVPDRQLSQLASATSKIVCNGGSDPWTGRQKFTLAFTTAAGKVQVPVYADVAEAATPIVVALRSVAKGNVITAADVEVRTIEPSAKNAGQRTTFDSIENLIGKEARQALQQDEIVYSDQIQSPLLVKKGDVITVASQSGGIRVRTTAKAAQDGAQGDLIQVEAMGSKQRYDARVVGLREASVFAPAHLAAPQKTASSQTAQRQLPDVK